MMTNFSVLFSGTKLASNGPKKKTQIAEKVRSLIGNPSIPDHHGQAKTELKIRRQPCTFLIKNLPNFERQKHDTNNFTALL
jgi:hypothetical protein